ncbi:hypothetical protein BJ322DRAFT_412813 [Thelephora terrestris]|uniref:Secreted protein n=1 Tax=Thelephora terrestris TaxID=56493 RepID=A0A9P6HN25_9AGAM|nr:hypothetical protein BJ322DRAFT_412813 [Thelephora terrestris]
MPLSLLPVIWLLRSTHRCRCTSRDTDILGSNRLYILHHTEKSPNLSVEIQLRALSDDWAPSCYALPKIRHSLEDTEENVTHFVSTTLTSSRLAMLASVLNRPSLLVWDWRSAQVSLELEAEVSLFVKSIGN